jgi:hypothetical protein
VTSSYDISGDYWKICFGKPEAFIYIRGYILRPYKESFDSGPGGDFNNESGVVGNERAPIAIEDDIG